MKKIKWFFGQILLGFKMSEKYKEKLPFGKF